jgi:8-amino-7-oxononanoate synthase
MARIPVESSTATTICVNGRQLLAFGGCNYLGMANRSQVHEGLVAALSQYGISTTASRETTGNTLIHEELESALAEFTGQEASILSAEGYTANFMCAQALTDDLRVAIIDANSHRSIRNAATAAGMFVFEFEHLNPDSAAWLIRQHADAGVAVMTDSVFAADGAIAPLRELLSILPAQRSALVVDDCHGFCVLGPGGRGAVPHLGIDDPRVCITTTLAKGLGCYGGTVLGRTKFIRSVRERAWVYRSSTPVPPPLAGAALAAVKWLQANGSIVTTLRDNIKRMRSIMEHLGLPTPPQDVPIFTFYLDNDARNQSVHDQLLADGILAPLIEYPGGPCERYFRVVINAMHTAADIERLGDKLDRAIKASGYPAPMATTK